MSRFGRISRAVLIATGQRACSRDACIASLLDLQSEATQASPLRGGANRSSPVEHLEHRVLLAAQPYNWQNAAIGGGGFVDGVFFSPTQQNVIYVRTDIGGLYKTTNGGTTWNQLLDFVGPATSPSGFSTNDQEIGVLSFAIDPENPNNIYADVGEYSGTNGAVFYSTNGGTTWGEDNLSFYVGGNSNGRGEGERIAVDPFDSNIIMLGSNANGLWESTNQGNSFTQESSFSTTASINFVYFNPYGGPAGSPTQNIFLGVNSIAGLSPQTTAAEPTNLYQTTNGGTSWNAIAGSSNSPGKNIAAVSVSSLNRSGATATVHTASATSIVAGDLVTIAGASPSAFNGTFAVATVTSTTAFTYAVASGSGSATGTISTAVNYSCMPNHIALASDGNLYVTCSDAQAPNGTQTTGGVYRYNINTGTWAVISPQVPGIGTNPQYGYMGLALDPENPQTVVVTTINDYSGPDALYRTINASSPSPTWVALYSTSTAQNYGYGGYDSAQYIHRALDAPFGDGIGNWPCSVAIDQFNPGHILYGDGQGLWATSIGNSSGPLTAANSWYFPDNGIEFTAVGTVAAAPTGTPLFAALGDIDGFAFTTLTTSPAQGSIASGSGNSIDFAGTNPNDVAIVGSMGSTNGAYSTSDGTSFTAFASSPSGAVNGSVAVTAGTSNMNIVWAASGMAPYYSTNDGTTWTASSGGLPTGGTIVSDRINPNDFYYYSENSNDNALSLYISTNAGVSFTLASTTATGNCSLTASPYTAGDLWLTSYSGLWHSTNFGTSFNYGAGVGVQSASLIALGKNAPGQTYPALYIYGEIGNVTGVYRSDNQGSSWIQINDSAHQWGGLIQTIAADPNVFGRVYLGTNGRGVIVGNPVTSLPTGWTDSDINTPGDPGFATSSINESTGTIVNQWTINGGGAGIIGTSDQFNFASETVNASGTAIVGELTALNNAGTGTPQAGLMFRAGPATSTDPFAAILQSTAGQLLFEYRATSGGNITSTALSGVSIGTEYLDLVCQGGNYSAYYGTDGIHWTQLGSTVAISAIPANASAGVAVTSNYNPQLASATFSSVRVVALPTPAVAVTSNSTSPTFDQPINFTATVTPASGNNETGTVQFLIDGSDVGSAMNLSGGTASYSTSTLNAGSHSIAAIYSGDGNFNGSTSPVFTQQVSVGMLNLNGAAFYLKADSNPRYLDIWTNTTATGAYNHQVLLANIGAISVQGTTGADSVVVDFSAGNPLPSGGLTDTGGGNGTGDELSVIGSNGNDVIASSASQLIINGETINLSKVGLTTFTPGTGTDSLSVNSGTLELVPPVAATWITSMTFSSINIGAGAELTVAAPTTFATRSIVVTSNLNIAQSAGTWTGTLDLSANDMVIHGGSLSTITTQIQAGYHAANWLGSGITSSAAAGNTTHLTAIGAIQNSVDGSVTGAALYSSAPNSLGLFDGMSLANTDVLLKYTYVGDANLDGKIDGSDYSRIDDGFTGQSTGWFNGDFNYDYAVDGSDYTLIDNAFNTQGAAFNAEFSAPFAIPVERMASASKSSSTTRTTAVESNGSDESGSIVISHRRSSNGFSSSAFDYHTIMTTGQTGENDIPTSRIFPPHRFQSSTARGKTLPPTPRWNFSDVTIDQGAQLLPPVMATLSTK